MRFFAQIKSGRQRSMLKEFVERFDGEVMQDGSIRAFWLLDEDYVDDCAMYPQYVVIADGQIDYAELDQLHFRLQDQYGWPCGHYFTNSPSRKNSFTSSDIVAGLKPEDAYLDASDIKKITGRDYVPLVDCTAEEDAAALLRGFEHLGEQIDRRQAELEVDLISEHIESYRRLQPGLRHRGVAFALDNGFYRRRGRAPTRPTAVLERIKKSVDEYLSGGRPQHHLLYGRTNGSGKSQYLYHLMGYLQQTGYPFVYKELLYFHFREHLQQKDSGSRTTYFAMVDGEPQDQQVIDRMAFAGRRAAD